MKKIDCKENAEDSNRAISVTVHLLAYMETGEVRSDISLKFDEFNNEMEMYDIVDRSLVEEKNLGPNTFPLTRSYDMKLSDIIEAVNMQKNSDEIQQECEPEEPRVRYECVPAREMMKTEIRYRHGASYSQLMHKWSMS